MQYQNQVMMKLGCSFAQGAPGLDHIFIWLAPPIPRFFHYLIFLPANVWGELSVKVETPI